MGWSSSWSGTLTKKAFEVDQLSMLAPAMSCLLLTSHLTPLTIYPTAYFTLVGILLGSLGMQVPVLKI